MSYSGEVRGQSDTPGMWKLMNRCRGCPPRPLTSACFLLEDFVSYYSSLGMDKGRSIKIPNACGLCKQRKRRCDGQTPCR